ncbi:hypothetical protein [Sneathiella litorea]|uniref:Uncharacterized protein n=1 Tax=Sneathiella litorea TaxID=2606216 RepID=A0A6L8W301_9PROT|nr:hypothetical protein [Sneathiella litorea]MZR29348.1 hypothetical protein [Sneathiella litorea]
MQGLQGLQAFFAAQGLHGLHAFFAAHGLHAFFAAQALQAFLGAQAATAPGTTATAAMEAIAAAVNTSLNISLSCKFPIFFLSTDCLGQQCPVCDRNPNQLR